MAKSRKALGRGLGALISTPSVPVNAEDGAVVELPAKRSGEAGVEQLQAVFLKVEKVHPAANQPRKDFAKDELQDLANSIKSLGILQPIVVRSGTKKGTYEIVAGERRWRAAQLAGLDRVPAIIKAVEGDRQAFELALVENVQRSNLNPIEEALAFQSLADDFSLTQDQISKQVGKSRTAITNSLRLLNLPEKVKGMIADGTLSVGHAKVILTVKEPAVQTSLATRSIKESLSVRTLEEIVSRSVDLTKGKKKKGKAKSKSSGVVDFPEVCDQLRNTLGTKVLIKHDPKGRGRIEIQYYSEEELDRLVEHICR